MSLVKYTKEQLENMSDYEINKLICLHLPVMIEGNQDVQPIDSDSAVMVNDIVNMYPLDFCNNPSDMMPLVFESEITVAKHCNLNEWECFGGGYQVNHNHEIESICNIDAMHSNPLRAAAIVYLLINSQG